MNFNAVKSETENGSVNFIQIQISDIFSLKIH